jgi:hypothetical protein
MDRNGLCSLSLPAQLILPTGCVSNAAPAPDRLSGLVEFRKLCVPTHMGIFGDITTVTTYEGGIFYRQGPGPWAEVPIELNGAHSIAQLPNGRWIIGDTENNRLVQLDDLSGKGKVVIRSEIAGLALRRPHDAAVDLITGDIYVVDGERRLFRFKELEGPAEVWTFTQEQLGYVRSLSWFDGHLHVIDSSRGEILRIDSYRERHYTLFRSPRPKNTPAAPFSPYGDFVGGALATTGLVLNDVEKAESWYYGTNFFAPMYAFGGDTGPARLIRWRSWPEFERGAWEDMSQHLPDAKVPLVPYFLTVHQNALYVAMFETPDSSSGTLDGNRPCDQDGIIRIDLAVLGTSQ